MNVLVIDIETKNTFQDVGGRANVKDLSISVVGVYSYKEDRYFALEEHELDYLVPLLKQTQLLVTFAGKRFDLPVMEKYFNFNIGALNHYDILEKIEEKLQRRVSLNVLAEANLGLQKTGKSIDAVTLYLEGKIEELKSYCLNDVKLTKELYELIKKQKFLWIPQKDTKEMLKLEIEPPEEPPQRLLI